jgi:isopenicillin N synthase-like dioxygenase
MAGDLRISPIIDISAGDSCVESVHEACRDTGFFVVVGHGLDDELSALFDAARTFFALPQQEKERVPRVDRYGYVPHSSGAIDTTRQSDNTEFMDLGLGDEVELPDLAGFETAVRAYQAAALEVGARLLRFLAMGLGAPEGFFADRMRRPQCRLRFLHYLPLPVRPDGSLPVPNPPHTDYGAITMLATDGVPGLEVKPLGADWTPVEAPPGSLVVNLGDMLARWTNDVYRSTPHRVVGSPDRHRYSIPFFVNPDPETIVECIPACVSDANPCRYDRVTAGEFLAQRIDRPEEPYVSLGEGPPRPHVPSEEVST